MARGYGSHALAFLAALLWAARHASAVRAQAGATARLQAAVKAMDGAAANAHDTPVTRVVNLLKAMEVTLKKDMDEDEALYGKLNCWCQSSKSEREAAASASEARIGELEPSIEALTAQTAELKANLKDLENELTSDKTALTEAQAVYQKEQTESHGDEVASIQAIESLRAAIEVLSRRQVAPESSVAGGPILSTPEDSFESFLAAKSVTTRIDSWTEQHKASHLAQPLEDFMRSAGLDDGGPEEPKPAGGGFLQGQQARAAGGAAGSSAAASLEEAAVVQRALRSAAAFMQARHRAAYYPAYGAQSGEVLGVLRQLKDEMESDLKEAKSRAQSRGSAFEALRSAKTDEILNGEKISESKEDELATAKSQLAQDKQGLRQEEAALEAAQKFLTDLEATCAAAETSFEQRKAARLTELQALTEAVEILTQDQARDAMSATYGLVQLTASARAGRSGRRQQAATALRAAARRARDPQLSLLAESVKLNAFVKVKAAIDHMVSTLKVEQEDEVKKNDFCIAEIHENEMGTERKQDEKGDLEARGAQLASDVGTMEAEISDAKRQIAQLQLDLQQAGKDRQAENLEYQRAVHDQLLTEEALRKALRRLEAYYKQALLQEAAPAPSPAAAPAASPAAAPPWALAPAVPMPPVAQPSYEPSEAASGAMQLMEKLIQDARAVMADAKASERQAQAAYEETVVDTNAAVAALLKEVSSKSEVIARAAKEKLQAESDLADVETELEGLAKYGRQLHSECDYIVQNFRTRQDARADEIEALQRATQILSGATMR
mmetsp:Transcript_78589/g.230573  ORF Transcript_78589/g.230573 Transcript_78589/m.230573 type:complete len:784 (+) Transcript_78589:75-2426(+)